VQGEVLSLVPRGSVTVQVSFLLAERFPVFLPFFDVGDLFILARGVVGIRSGA